MVVCTHECSLCAFCTTLELTHFLTFIKIVKEDIDMSDSLIVTYEEIEVVSCISVVVVR